VRNEIRNNVIQHLGHYQAQTPFTTTIEPNKPR
jgi:hypothetical protein